MTAAQVSRDVATASKLPIPDGWSVYPHGRRWIVIHCSVGGVTIDVEQRVVRPGYTATRGKAIDAMIYTGRGWLAELHADAVAWLQAIAQDRSKR